MHREKQAASFQFRDQKQIALWVRDFGNSKCTNVTPRSISFERVGKNLDMKTTVINRANTNQEVFRRANMALQHRNNHSDKIQKISEMLCQRRVALVGHILRQPRTNPLRNVCFRQSTAAPFEVLYRRQGRPRKRWIDSTLQFVWDTIRPNEEDFHQSPEQLAFIQDAANNYQL